MTDISKEGYGYAYNPDATTEDGLYDPERQHESPFKTTSNNEQAAEVFDSMAGDEKVHDIKYRTMSWQRTTLLLFGDQVCLAIMSQSWTLEVLGWVPGLIASFVCGIVFWISSHTLWQFIMKHPYIRDVCDVGYLIFGQSRLAYLATLFMLIAYNIVLCGFHVFVSCLRFLAFNWIGSLILVLLFSP